MRYIHIYIYACMHTYLIIFDRVCAYLYIYIYMYVLMCTCIYIYILTYIIVFLAIVIAIFIVIVIVIVIVIFIYSPLQNPPRCIKQVGVRPTAAHIRPVLV